MDNQNNNKWIPISEGLPKEKGRYLCTALFGEKPSVHELSFHTKCWMTLTWQPIALDKVVAYMPLPKAFEITIEFHIHICGMCQHESECVENCKLPRDVKIICDKCWADREAVKKYQKSFRHK